MSDPSVIPMEAAIAGGVALGGALLGGALLGGAIAIAASGTMNQQGGGAPSLSSYEINRGKNGRISSIDVINGLGPGQNAPSFPSLPQVTPPSTAPAPQNG